MLNGDLKKESIEKLQAAQDRYKKSVDQVQKRSEKLFTLRQHSSHEVIGQVEGYINALANTPKEFDRSFAAYKAEFKTFTETIKKLEIEAAEIDFKAGSSAAAGVAAGVGTAALGPAALMGIATTFGTASTGAAISTLGGAAATNAALAWLGGGAVVAGGGGMAGGSALVALTGPIGWAIGGAALVGSGLFARSKNRQIAEEANTHRNVVETYDAQMQAAAHEVGRLVDLTEQHAAGVMNLLKVLTSNAPKDYCSFSPQHKEQLAALINHIRSLSKLLNLKVDPSGTTTSRVSQSTVPDLERVKENPPVIPTFVKIPGGVEGVQEVQISQWHVKVGDHVKKGQIIATITVKYVPLNVLASIDGVITWIEGGNTVRTGNSVACIEPQTQG